MPITKSAKKALKASTKRAEVNAYMKTGMKNATKLLTKGIKSGADNIKELVIDAQKKIDKAAKKNIISKNSASRKISSLMSAVAATK